MTGTVRVRRTFVAEYECPLSDYEDADFREIYELEVGVDEPEFFVGDMEQVDCQVSIEFQLHPDLDPDLLALLKENA